MLARDDFGSPRVAGVFLAAFGAGAVVGSLLAIRLVTRIEPIRLGAGALLLLTLPIPLLGLTLPVAAVIAVLFASAAFGPIVNAPLLAVIVTRSPEALRPKVMVRAADLRAARRPARAAGRGAAARHLRRTPGAARDRRRADPRRAPVRVVRVPAPRDAAGDGRRPALGGLVVRTGRRFPWQLPLPRCRRSRHRTPTSRRATSRRRSRRSPRARGGRALPDAARRDRHREDRHDGLDHREDRPPGAHDRAQQDARRAALQRVPRVLPDNAVEYFVSYYDYYQPEAYVPRPTSTSRRTRPGTTTSSRLRLAATYGAGSPRRDVVARRLGVVHLRPRLAGGVARARAHPRGGGGARARATPPASRGRRCTTPRRRRPRRVG